MKAIVDEQNVFRKSQPVLRSVKLKRLKPPETKCQLILRIAVSPCIPVRSNSL